MGDTGLEQPSLSPIKTPISKKGGAKSGALDSSKPLRSNQNHTQEQEKKLAKKTSPSSADLPEDLRKIIASWNDLPSHVRATIMTLVDLQS